MTTITIYENEKEVSRESIKQQYHIAETSLGELFWHEKLPNPPKGGALLIWLQNRIQPSGKKLELRYKEYRFVFQFD